MIHPGQMVFAEGGFTKREYFAAAALSGLLSDSNHIKLALDDANKKTDDKKVAEHLIENYFTEMSVRYANALITDLAIEETRDLKRQHEERDSYEF